MACNHSSGKVGYLDFGCSLSIIPGSSMPVGGQVIPFFRRSYLKNDYQGWILYSTPTHSCGCALANVYAPIYIHHIKKSDQQ